MSGTKDPGDVSATCVGINRDDVAGTHQLGSLNDIQADGTTADHAHGFIYSDICNTRYRANTGDDRASQQACKVKRHILGNTDRTVSWHNRVFRKR
ncbi:hypothetical protein ASG50_27980 [Rhizobium sp. Leaf386]|nr:hypothetical protein ASG50_27980 [Rhizobium sp. Leaf386]